MDFFLQKFAVVNSTSEFHETVFVTAQSISFSLKYYRCGSQKKVAWKMMHELCPGHSHWPVFRPFFVYPCTRWIFLSHLHTRKGKSIKFQWYNLFLHLNFETNVRERLLILSTKNGMKLLTMGIDSTKYANARMKTIKDIIDRRSWDMSSSLFLVLCKK